MGVVRLLHLVPFLVGGATGTLALPITVRVSACARAECIWQGGQARVQGSVGEGWWTAASTAAQGAATTTTHPEIAAPLATGRGRGTDQTRTTSGTCIGTRRA